MKNVSTAHLRTGALVASAGLALCLLAGCAGPSPTEVAQQFLDGVKANDTEALQASYSGDADIFGTWEGSIVSADSGDETAGDGSTTGDEAATDDSTLASDDQATAEIRSAVDNDLVPKLREFDYELSNEQIDGDTATVDVKITTYAAGDAFSSFMSDYISQAFTLALSGASEDQITELASSIFSSKIKTMEKSYTDTVTLNLTKVDGSWKVDALDNYGEIADALVGGLITTAQSIESAYGDAGADNASSSGEATAA